MPFTVAQAANFQLAAPAFSVLSAIHLMYIAWFDPLTTAATRAVDSILGSILLVFSVPISLEINIEQSFNMLERYMISRTALGGHVLRICNGKLEDAS